MWSFWRCHQCSRCAGSLEPQLAPLCLQFHCVYPFTLGPQEHRLALPLRSIFPLRAGDPFDRTADGLVSQCHAQMACPATTMCRWCRPPSASAQGVRQPRLLEVRGVVSTQRRRRPASPVGLGSKATQERGQQFHQLAQPGKNQDGADMVYFEFGSPQARWATWSASPPLHESLSRRVAVVTCCP